LFRLAGSIDGKTIGIVIGSVVGGILLLCLLFMGFAWWRAKKGYPRPNPFKSWRRRKASPVDGERNAAPAAGDAATKPSWSAQTLDSVAEPKDAHTAAPFNASTAEGAPDLAPEKMV
jgi:hypothetical protein